MNVTVSLSPSSLRPDLTADAAVVRGALVRPLHFRYSGPLDLFQTWGLCGPSMHRDADILSESNFETITADMTARFPKDCAVVYSTHPSLGWCNQLAVRVLGDDGEVTRAFRALLEWRKHLQTHPVADEVDYSRRREQGDSRWGWPAESVSAGASAHSSVA